MDPEGHQKAEVKTEATGVKQLKISRPPDPGVSGKGKMIGNKASMGPKDHEKAKLKKWNQALSARIKQLNIGMEKLRTEKGEMDQESMPELKNMKRPEVAGKLALQKLLMAGITLFTTVYGHGLSCDRVYDLVYIFRRLMEKYTEMHGFWFRLQTFDDDDNDDHGGDDDESEFLIELLQELKNCEHTVYVQTSKEDERVLFLLYHTICLFMLCKISMNQRRIVSKLDEYAKLLLEFRQDIPFMEHFRFRYIPPLLDELKHSKTSSKLEFVNTEKQIGEDTTEESVESVSVSNLSEPEVYWEKGKESYLSRDYLNAARYAATALCLLPPEDSDELTGFFYHELGNFFFKIWQPERGLTSRCALHRKLSEHIPQSHCAVDDSLAKLDFFSAALLGHKNALKIRLKLRGRDEQLADTYHAVGESHAKLADFPSALKNHESALKIRLKLFGDHEKSAESYHAVGESQAQLGDFPSVLKKHGSALKIRLKLLEDQEKIAESYHEVGESQAQLGDFRSSLENHERALTIRLELLGDHEKTAESYNAVGETQAQLGKFRSALENHHSALWLRLRLHGDREKTAESYHAVGETQAQLGNFPSALKNHESALKTRLKLLGDHEKTVESYHAVGESQAKLGDFSAALESHKNALNLQLKLLGEHEKTVLSYHAVALLHAKLGDHSAELDSYKNGLGIGLKLLRKTPGSHHALDESQTSWFRNISDGSDELTAELHNVSLAESYHDVGELQVELGDLSAAQESHKNALKIRLKLLGGHEKTVESYYKVGLVHAKLEDFSAELSSYKNGLWTCLKLLGVHTKIARLYHVEGHLQPEVALHPKSCVVGSDGAELSYYGCTVSIPAGALEEDTEIAISLEVLNTDLSELVVSPVLKLEPSNLTFKRPVKVTLPLVVSPSPAVPEAEWPELTVMCYAEGKWSKVHTAKFTFGNSRSFECTHFSAYCFTIDENGQRKAVKRLACLLYKERGPVQQGDPTEVTVAICDDLQGVIEQLEVRLREKGLCFVDGGQTLCVQRGESVTVQVDFNTVGIDAKVDPVAWVIPPKDVWAEFLKKFETFSVTSNAVNNNRFKVRFDVKSESGSEVKLRCPLGTVEEFPNVNGVEQTNGQVNGNSTAVPAPGKTKKPHLLFLAPTWGWTEGDGSCSTSKEMAVQFAKNKGVQVSCLVANTTKDLHDKAKQQNVQLFSARCMNGFSALDCLSFPPDNVACVDAIVGYGKLVGRHAQPIKLKYTNSKWIHIAHSSFAVEDEGDEIHFCQDSDLTVAIGGNVTEVCERQLRFCRKMVHGFIPGILKEFQVYQQSDCENRVFSVITFYPSATELNAGKGIYSIPAKAVRCLSQSERQVQLICICAPGDSPDEVKKILQQLEIPIENSILRSHCESLEKRCKTLVGADLLILPYLTSKFDDFGLIALQAVSTDLPILVTENAGLGKALKKVPNGDACVVNCDRPEDWARRISTVKGKTRKLRLLEATIRRESYDKIYPWEGQCEEVLNKILQVV